MPNWHHRDDGFLDNVRFDALSPYVEACLEEIAKLVETPTGIQDTGVPNNEENHPNATTSAELLKSFGSYFKLLNGDKIVEPTSYEERTAYSVQEVGDP
ncbi:putative GRAS family transcription factor [Tripterygium wilfordii]|uniref:Putative GRAS family transcription factor n=1 Tax=Tripterygium wilfordii TaxID=458696 RepID=A0A7J7E0T1_TRIWF|nr:putative GRAS family transcription factor [Tripterygium wilfordii]